MRITNKMSLPLRNFQTKRVSIVHCEGQDYLKYHWGFNMAGNNEEKVEAMWPKGSVFPFMDDIIVESSSNIL